MREPPYAVPAGVANVVAHVPEQFDDAQKIHLVLFFHGAVQCAAQLGQIGDVVCKPGMKTLGGYGYDDRHDDAVTNSLFAIPQFAFFSGGTPGRMNEKGYFPKFVSELLGETFAPGVGAAKTLDDVADITLIAHSAGFNPVIMILSRAELAAKVKNVVLLDSFFAGGEAYYQSWFSKRTSESPRRFIAVYGDSGDSNGHHAVMAKYLKAGPWKTAVMPKGSLVEAMRNNDATIAQMPVNHYWMPTMLLAKVVAGLDLPSRPVPIASIVGAPRAPNALAVGDVVSGSLDEGDAVLTNGSFADEYALTLGAGASITLETKGGPSLTETCCTVDVLTQIFDGDQLLAADDDGAGFFDSALTFTAPHAGIYRVRVTTSGSGYKRGPYSLKAKVHSQ